MKSIDLVMRSCLVGILFSRLQAIFGVFPEGTLEDKDILLNILSQIFEASEPQRPSCCQTFLEMIGAVQ